MADTDEVIESPSGWSYRASQENGDQVDCQDCGSRLDDNLPIVNDDDGYAYHPACLERLRAELGATRDLFTLDVDKFDAWLADKIEEDELDATPAAVVLQDFADENLGARVDEFCYQLIEAGGIICATGWSIGIYPIDTEDSWAYLLTVRPDNEHHGQFVQVTGLSEDLSSEETMVDLFDELVADANRLLPAARAALDAMNPPAETPRLVAVVNGDGELACPECGNTQFGYEENVVEYRYPGGQDPAAKTVSVIHSFEGSAESGDSDPGLFCDTYRSKGCGKPIDLPDGWEISYG